jgi:hypothetical protein
MHTHINKYTNNTQARQPARNAEAKYFNKALGSHYNEPDRSNGMVTSRASLTSSLPHQEFVKRPAGSGDKNSNLCFSPGNKKGTRI